MHALFLVVMYVRGGSPKFELAAVRLLARLAMQGREVRLNEMQWPRLRSRACEARSDRAKKTPLRLL